MELIGGVSVTTRGLETAWGRAGGGGGDGSRILLRQIFRFGFFHADPTPATSGSSKGA